jgi:hypothetical protein
MTNKSEAHMGKIRMILKPERRRQLGRPSMDGKTILKWIFKK